MNCFNHPTETAVSQCVECGKGLCLECTSQFSKPICSNCFSAYWQREKRTAFVELLLTLVIGLPFGIFMSALFHTYDSTGHGLWGNFFFVMYFGLGLVPGWRTLTRVTPQVFLFLPILGWVIYFLIKAVLAMFVGLIAFPVRIIRNLGILFK